MAQGAGTTGIRFPIRAKFTFAVSALTVLISLLIVAAEQLQVRRVTVAQSIALGDSIADSIASTCGYYVIFGLTDDLRPIAADLGSNLAVEYADFLSAEGEILAATDPTKRPAAFAGWSPGKAATKHWSAESDSQTLQLFVRPFYEDRAEAGKPGAKPRGYFRLALNEQATKAAVRRLALTNGLVLLGALILGIGFATIGARIMVRPIADMVESARRVASGDLTGRAEIRTSDEIGALSSTFNQMAADLQRTLARLRIAHGKLNGVVQSIGSRARDVHESIDRQGLALDQSYGAVETLNGGIRKITENVEALSASSEETSSSILEMVASLEEVSRHTDSLFASVEDTSSATNQMVSSINEVDHSMEYLQNFVTETSSSMVEMSASISQVQTNAERSLDLAQAAAEAAESGMRSVNETIDGMEQIRQSVLEANAVVNRLGERSASIGKILGVIEDVAEQTNLLALNAAILAAQAGEQGKGFSVVAAEIRELSERTATSTREISTLIRAVQDEVETLLRTMARGSRLVEGGVTLSHEAGRSLGRILDSAVKSSEMVREIATATREQALGSEGVARAIDKLHEMVRQINTATSQQATGSDHILRAVETMREVTRYVRQATNEQKSGSVMISKATEKMIDKVHEIFEVAANQSAESEKIVSTVDEVRRIAEANRRSAAEMHDSVSVLIDATRELDEEVRKFKVRG